MSSIILVSRILMQKIFTANSIIIILLLLLTHIAKIELTPEIEFNLSWTLGYFKYKQLSTVSQPTDAQQTSMGAVFQVHQTPDPCLPK